MMINFNIYRLELMEVDMDGSDSLMAQSLMEAALPTQLVSMT